MKEINQFEANLVRMLRSILSSGSSDLAFNLINKKCDLPGGLGRSAVELVRETLAKGIVRSFATLGWKSERFLKRDRNDISISEGRLWERSNPHERQLSFTAQTLDLLIWLTGADPTKTTFTRAKLPRSQGAKANGRRNSCPTKLGDELFAFLTFQKLDDPDIRKALLKTSLFRNSGLIWLIYPDEIAKTTLKKQPPFDYWMSPDRAWVLESLQDVFVTEWHLIERRKQRSKQHKRIQAIGERQQQVLNAFLDSANKHGRRDLTRFLLKLTASMVEDGNVEEWYRKLDVRELRLVDRQEIYHLALVVLRKLEVLQKWQASARAVTFYDEDYESSQLWKSDWEALGGDRLVDLSRTIIERFDPLNV